MCHSLTYISGVDFKFTVLDPGLLLSTSSIIWFSFNVTTSWFLETSHNWLSILILPVFQYRNFSIHISDQSWQGAIFCQVNQILGVNDENTGNCQSGDVCTLVVLTISMRKFSVCLKQSSRALYESYDKRLHLPSFHQTVHFTITMADSARSIKIHHNSSWENNTAGMFSWYKTCCTLQLISYYSLMQLLDLFMR